MKKTVILALILVAQTTFAAKIGVDKLTSPSAAREAIDAHMKSTYKGNAEQMKLAETIMAAIQPDKLAIGEIAKFKVRTTPLSSAEKLIVSDILKVSAENLGYTLQGGPALVDAIAKRPEMLTDVVQLISTGKESEADLKLLVKSLKSMSSTDGATQQKEILSISKIISLSKVATGSLKTRMEKAKKALEEGKSAFEALKAVGLKTEKTLEDFIIC